MFSIPTVLEARTVQSARLKTRVLFSGPETGTPIVLSMETYLLRRGLRRPLSAFPTRTAPLHRTCADMAGPTKQLLWTQRAG